VAQTTLATSRTTKVSQLQTKENSCRIKSENETLSREVLSGPQKVDRDATLANVFKASLPQRRAQRQLCYHSLRGEWMQSLELAQTHSPGHGSTRPDWLAEISCDSSGYSSHSPALATSRSVLNDSVPFSPPNWHITCQIEPKTTLT